MLDRRAFLGAFGLLAAPLAAEAQQAGRVYRVGYVSPASPPQGVSPAWTAFLEGLREQGFVEGTHVVVERRYASGGGVARVRQLLADLVALNVEVIVTVTTTVAFEAKKSIKHLPIIMAASSDPVGGGVVDSLGRPAATSPGFRSPGQSSPQNDSNS